MSRRLQSDLFFPTVVLEDGHPVALVKAGDAVIHYNFRPDRARQLTKAFVLQELPPRPKENLIGVLAWPT